MPDSTSNRRGAIQYGHSGATTRVLPQLVQALLLCLAMGGCTSKPAAPSITLSAGDLVMAVEDGDIDRVSLLLRAGMSPNDEDEEGRTAMLVAVGTGRLDIASTLVRFGASLEVPRLKDVSLLNTAAAQGNVEMVQFLLRAGLDVNEVIGGASPLMLAVTTSDLDMIACLLKAGADPTIQVAAMGSVFHFAARSATVEALQVLLKGRSTSDVDRLNARGLSPLQVALLMQRDVTSREFINHGCDIEFITSDGENALHLAAAANCVYAAKAMLARRQALVHQRSQDGRTPLLVASYSAGPEMVALIIDAKADITMQDEEGFTALHWAALAGQAKNVEVLLERGADSSQVDKHGRTASTYAQDADTREVFAKKQQ